MDAEDYDLQEAMKLDLNQRKFMFDQLVMKKKVNKRPCLKNEINNN